jgi:Domain of unknown function (DUF4124)
MVVKHYFSSLNSAIVLCNASLFAALIFCCTANAEGIVKWKDSNGVTHYGDKLPAQEAGRTNTVLNKQGMVIKTNDPNEARNRPEQERVQTEQTRRDTALLASYSSEEEVDIARDRNLQMDEFSLQSQYQRVEMLKRDAVQNSTSVALYNKRKQPIPDKLKQQIKQNQIDTKKTAESIIATKKSMEETKIRYANDKARYAELKPRNQSITDIKYRKKTLAELQEWKADVQNRLNQLQNNVKEEKRSGKPISTDLSQRIQKTTEEDKRADIEISLAIAALKNSEQGFSKKTQAVTPPAKATYKTPTNENLN